MSNGAIVVVKVKAWHNAEVVMIVLEGFRIEPFFTDEKPEGNFTWHLIGVRVELHGDRTIIKNVLPQSEYFHKEGQYVMQQVLAPLRPLINEYPCELVIDESKAEEIRQAMFDSMGLWIAR